VKFYRWLAKVTADLEGILTNTGRGGAPAVHRRLEEAFGSEPVRKALSVMGDQARGMRETGRLRVGDGGRLTVGTGLPVRDHRFFGGPTPA
jgi:hypothetical protein